MNYLEDFTNKEWEYICTVIPFQEAIGYFKKYPEEFAKLRPGFRVKSLTDEFVKKILYDFRHKNFIASFLVKHIDRWVKEINEELAKVVEKGLDQESAYIDVLSRSFFSGDITLFFKIKGEEKSEDYLAVMKSAVSYESVNQKKREEERLSLIKKKSESEDSLDVMKKKISEREKKIEELKKKDTEQKEEQKKILDILERKQGENEQLIVQLKNLEEELEKVKEDNIWKTAEMQQKMEFLAAELKMQVEQTDEYESRISEYVSKLSVAEEEIETWKHKVRTCEKQLFTMKVEKAALLSDKKSYIQQIQKLKESLENEKENIKTVSETFLERYRATDCKMPLHPENMDDFDEYFVYNLTNIGFDMSTDGSLDFIKYLEKTVFNGIPLLIKRGPGINLANCLANTLYGVPFAAVLSYSEKAGVQEIREFLANTVDRVICIDGFVGNCNEIELISVLDQYRNKIIILTYMYDRTLSFVPCEILSSVHYICADRFTPILRIKDITEDPSEVKEKEFAYQNSTGCDNRLQKIFIEIACECGFREDTARAIAAIIDDENYMNNILMFTILPYVSKVFGKSPYNCSKRLQRYAGETGRCPKKEIMMRWFG